MTYHRPSRETIGERMYRHGHARREKSPTYSCWMNMVSRCGNENIPAYASYGAKGIKVCGRWLDFTNFLADMGERPSGAHSLDRWPDKSGNYEPGNVRWATSSEQARNRKSCRTVVRDDGLTFPSIIAAAEATGGNRRCIRDVCSGRQASHHGRVWRFADVS